MSDGSLKRKRAPEQKFYAVHAGKEPGVYSTYQDCFAQINGFKGAKFKSFTTQAEADAFVRRGLTPRATSKAPQKFYGVQSGKVPGVYETWEEASKQVTGWNKPKYKSFPTLEAAEAFVRAAGEPQEAGASKGPKKQKKAKETDNEGGPDYGPGEGPLPDGAEDGFDPSVHLNPSNGQLEYKSDEHLNKVRLQAKGLLDDKSVKIWTDGSSRGNGTESAIAGVGVFFGPGDKRNLAEPLAGPRQTNQRAELTAILRALELSPRDRPVTIYSDSNYAINCVTKWFQKWRSNGWYNAAKKPVENRDIIEKILAYLEERADISRLYHGEEDDGDAQVKDDSTDTKEMASFETGRSRVKFVWVKGHASEEGNVQADRLAVAGSHKPRVEETM